ncbi:MAG: helix-hairpin-helix domain-containing protein, partial [bacterium]|nr:helix-hairpin-helix domain-containing protein [bacterium]
VAKVLPELRSGKEKEFYFPKTCPSCLAKLSKPEGEAVWRCPNPNCSARKRENLYYFVSKKAFDIDGLGPKIIDKLVDAGLISEVADLFSLREGDLVPLESLPCRKPKAFLRGFAEKSAKNLIETIQKSKKVPLSRFVLALGIRHVGEETTIDLASRFGSMNKLQKATKEELETIPDVGPKTAESIYNWFRLKQNQKFIEELFAVGIKIESQKPTPYQGEENRFSSSPFAVARETKGFGGGLKGKTFVLTGTLETMTRDQAKERIRLLGGNVSESVSKMTDYLVAGENPGSKFEQAKKLEIKIIGEKEFLETLSRRG